MAKNKNERFPVRFTPVGVLEPYAWINKPDDKFIERGVYSCKVAFDADNPKVVALVEEIEKAHKENFERQKKEFKENPPEPKKVKGKLVKPKPPTEGDLPFYTDEETGKVIFHFKKYASYTDKETKERVELPLFVVDSAGAPINDLPPVAAGSKIKVKFSILQYAANKTVGAGIKLQLESVMIVNLIEWTGSGGWGDEIEEDGYVAPKETKKANKNNQEKADKEDYDDDSDDDDSEEDGDF